ncbi:MAG: hypothetical protein R3272_05485 [Candidatus Promineifilaceae bacterium]|nr:hypothetical protein [Candidatus Promineifilaceae bacterium]
MSEQEELIRITVEDVTEANRLSLNCPICASPVDKYPDEAAMAPVFCTDCETLYHHACWEGTSGPCAVLGCQGESHRLYHTVDLEPALRISRRDLPTTRSRPRVTVNGSTRRLKRDEKRQRQARSFWRGLWENLLRSIRLWPSDRS